MRKLDLPYGDRSVSVEIPENNFVDYLAPNEIVLPDSDDMEIRRALDNPIGAPKIEEVVRPNETVALICEDITRFAQTDKMLEEIVKRLNAVGVADEQMTIVMALGSHRYMTEEEMVKKVGKELFGRLKVRNSEFRDKTKLVDMGLAPGNVRVWMDAAVQKFDRKIGIGSIAPHTAAGYTGGAKIIYPGVAGQDTVVQFHMRSATLGNVIGIADNESRLAMEKWVDVVGLDYIVNAVVSPNNQMYRVVAGHYVKAHREGVKAAAEIYGIKASRKVDVVVVSSHPADIDFWGGTKGITNTEAIVRDGGLIILLTPCPEGVGLHTAYPRYIAEDEPEKLLEEAWNGTAGTADVLPLAIGCAVAKIRRRVNFAVVSDGVSDEIVRESKMTPMKSVGDAVKFALEQYGPQTAISVVPFGGDSYVYV